MLPRVFNKHYKRKKQPNAVYIGRGSPYGNPFVVGRDGTRDEVCDRFECEILPTLDVSALRGKNLICFCKPLRCHGDAILKKANANDNSDTPMAGVADSTVHSEGPDASGSSNGDGEPN